MRKIRFQEWAGWSRWYTCSSYKIQDDCLQMFNVERDDDPRFTFICVAIPLHVIRGKIQVSDD